MRRVEWAQRKWCQKTLVFLSRETGIFGNFVGPIKGAKYRLDLQFLTWYFSCDAVAVKGSYCDDGGTTWFFSSCGGFLELRRGIQDVSCVDPGKSNIPFELRRKAGDCSRVTAGPIDLI